MNSAEFRRKMGLPPPGHDSQTRPLLPSAKPAKSAEALAGGSEGKTRGTGCPLVRFTLCRVSLLDIDAKYTAIKDLLDGLQYAGLIRGDKEGQIRLEVHQSRVAHYAEERTEIEIIYDDDTH